MQSRSVKINKITDNNNNVVKDTIKTMTYHERFVLINSVSNTEIRQKTQELLSKAKNPKVYYSILLSGVSTSGSKISDRIMKNAYFTIKQVFRDYWISKKQILNELLHDDNDEQLQIAFQKETN